MLDSRCRPVLVVGERGFIGRHVYRELQATSGRVFGGLTVSGKVVPARLLASLDTGVLARALAQHNVGVVVNCAGVTNGPDSVLTAGNVTLPEKLIQACALAGPIRIVHIGSSAEVGATDPNTVITEDRPPQPSSPYGVTKLAGSLLVRDACYDGVETVVVRVFNPIGSGMSSATMPGAAAHKIHSALSKGAPLRLGPLGAVRDFVDVRDVARAVRLAASVPALSGKLVNVARGEAVVARHVVRHMADVAGFTGKIHEWGIGSERSETVSWQRADITAARELLGWSPRYTVDEAVEELWRDFVSDDFRSSSLSA